MALSGWIAMGSQRSSPISRAASAGLCSSARRLIWILVQRSSFSLTDSRNWEAGSASERTAGSAEVQLWKFPIVDCTGFAARRALGNLRGVKGEMLVLRSHEISLSRPVRVLHPRIPVYIVPRGNGEFMVGATMTESDDSSRITARSIHELLSAAYSLHPAFADAEILEIGTQVRPAFADNLPRLHRIADRLYVNGLYRHGFLLAPALARRVAERVLNNRHYPEGDVCEFS
jgi:hypothetical protein